MYFNKTALPAQSETLVNYIYFLSSKLKALQSIKSYVAGVKTLHNLLELCTAGFSTVQVKLVWMGLENTVTHVPSPATPISPQVLIDIKETLNMNRPNDIAFWALCVTAFFILARKSNLVPDSKFDINKQLARSHLRFDVDFVDVYLHWTKTRKPSEEPMIYPLYWAQGSKICPYTARKTMCNRIPARGQVPCFMWEDGSPITYSQFMKKFRKCLAEAGYEPKDYSTHSFRSGGATWAFCSGVPGEFIKQLGGWKSGVYNKYLSFPREVRKSAILAMQSKLAKSGF